MSERPDAMYEAKEKEFLLMFSQKLLKNYKIFVIE